MDRAPLPLPLPRPKPGEAIVTTALAGALGLATWASLPFAAFVPALVPLVAFVVAPFAFHWLRHGLTTPKNAPKREHAAPGLSTAVRIGGGAFAYGAAASGTICGFIPALFQGGDALAYRTVVHVCVGATVGIVLWGPATLVALVAYGLPLRRATAAMDAAYPDVVDRALVRTHSALAIGAALALVVGGVGFAGAPCFRTFLAFAAAAVAVPVGVALRAQRRSSARNAWRRGELHLAPITDKDAERLPHLPILGDGAPPTHALVRVAAVGAYRSAAPPEEPLALVAVPEDDRASLRSR
jgi:hypothetical protein